MIEYKNIVRYDNLPFEDYLKLPGYSNSFLKNEKSGIVETIEPTEKMKIGSLVDCILTDAANVDMASPFYQIAKDIAFVILKQFKHLIRYFDSQVSYTADVEFNGFVMPTKGRIDLLLKNICVIDLKITWEKDVDRLIKRMEYYQQIWHYAKLAKVPKGYLLVYSVPLKRCALVPVDCRPEMNDFWSEKIISFGKVKEEITN